ncbi:MAG: ATP-binding cassette domain-containing protein [Hyphomicrobium zavarzinii]|uniref:ABC transporter ATP-binding protein n=1 Tax=Hyphomicrobium zavarzinii TaxID=48292 RepID=UPI001A5FF169|nr:ATP-binding cassette domain-containing protein [Hyphomicrobium zavarzinii]MBL8847711.1 ATP-binding cassette domain-containing protein [Hyphomicrobium zavarzinii]
MTALALEGVSHAYFGRTVLDRVKLDVPDGEIVSLVGPSGCGKSTLVHIAAGLIEPQRGRVANGYRRHGMIFQEHRLLPWATAEDNIAYPLRLAGVRCDARRALARAAADLVHLDRRDLEKYPVELSGGMRQRAAIARALVVEPDFVFFDEPFTALDVALKRQMQDLVIAAARQARFAGLFVTHDLAEAVRVSDRIVVLDERVRGVAGERFLSRPQGARDDAFVFATVQTFLNEDPLFAHIHDTNERRAS